MNVNIQIDHTYTAREDYRINYEKYSSCYYKHVPYKLVMDNIKKNKIKIKYVNIEFIYNNTYPDIFLDNANTLPSDNFLIKYHELTFDEKRYYDRGTIYRTNKEGRSMKYDQKYSLMQVYDMFLDRITKYGLWERYINKYVINVLKEHNVSFFQEILSRLDYYPLFSFDLGIQQLDKPEDFLIYLNAFQSNNRTTILNHFHYLFCHNFDLFIRCAKYDERIVKHIPINKVSENGQTLLIRAASINYVEAVNLICSLFPSLDYSIRDRKGKRAIDYAIDEGLKTLILNRMSNREFNTSPF